MGSVYKGHCFESFILFRILTSDGTFTKLLTGQLQQNVSIGVGMFSAANTRRAKCLSIPLSNLYIEPWVVKQFFAFANCQKFQYLIVLTWPVFQVGEKENDLCGTRG